MKKSWYSYLLIVVLLGLLGLLATLQYQWLGKISEAEKTRLESRLQEDTKRFTEDFNREIQKIYFGLQIDAEDFETNNWGNFDKRFALWKTNTAYPELVQTIYFYRKSDDPIFLKHDKNGFTQFEKNSELSEIEKLLSIEQNFSPILEKQMFLAIPVFRRNDDVKQIFIETKDIKTDQLNSEAKIQMPEKYGFLLVKLDEDLIAKKLFPDLTAKYFKSGDNADFKLSILNSHNGKVFETHQENISKADASAKIFSLTPTDFLFLSKGIGDNAINTKIQNHGNMVMRRNNAIISSKTIESNNTKNEIVSVNVQKVNDGKPRIAVFEGQGNNVEGIWTLKVQHSAGSLTQFINNTRYKNLAISFGILSLLAISIILIFLSSQRAKVLAQRQMDFVSSVSHEFRTPLAVIYSAGENLSDGVIDEKEKISNYGNLIKREGKKLSGMVEQILEFAGARSGKRKYDFRETDVQKIISDAINECQPLIQEQNFEVETEVSENLPKINADEQALTQAIQNLINNSLKYSNGKKWLKVSAQNGDGNLKISVEDKGIGISAKDLKQIFEPFYRAEMVVDEQISGNGLGLSLVKQIVEDHGGKINVKSELGNGSKFIVHLPLNIEK